MPANNPSPASKAPLSPDGKNVSRYANKDGSKFIALPKASPAAETNHVSTNPKATAMPSTQSSVIGPASNGPPPGVNPKKQKRRQKIAAKAAAAAAAANGHSDPSTSANAPLSPTENASAASAIENDDDADEPRSLPQAQRSRSSSLLSNGYPEDDATASGMHKKGKRKKNKKKKGIAAGGSDHPEGVPYRHHEVSRTQTNDRFWNTNSNEERERIKAFWISLSEDERKNLVKLEKDTILKKMKEQQKNTCSCAVCGRKRSAIEQELEGLYDSYYRELENYANRADGSLIGGPGNFALQPPREPHVGYPGPVPARGRLVEHVHEVEDDEEDSYVDEEYEDEDEVYSEDELSDDERRPDDRVIADFLDFGNSLQVKGGILTVADDLLKNDGRKFIEMMEQLAERRMARDEAPPGHYPRLVGGHRSNGYLPPHNHIHDEDVDEHDHEYEHDHDHDHDHHDHDHDHHGHIHDHDDHIHDHIHDHHHLHPDDDPEGEYAEDDEEEYDESQEGEYDDEEDEVEEAMTDQQRMEEGRRMFQIFAARMFEQRVLSAYKKKLATERTEKLLQELDDEKRLEEERKAQKASKAAKKRDRERQKKLAAQEAKAKKEADKAAEEAARKAEAEKRAEEQRRQVEEKRRAKEAQKKREEEERHRKEAERLKRAQEQERKAREARESKEREKRLKDEQRAKEKEAREAKERQARDQKERQQKEREQKEREARERREKQEAERQRKSDPKVERQDKEKQKGQAKPGSAAASKTPSVQAALPKGSKRQQAQQPQAAQSEKQQPPATVTLPQHPAPPATYASPKVAVATPILPPRTLSHPIRSRTSSQQQDSASGATASQQGSATSHSGSPHATTPAHSSPGAIGSQSSSHAAYGVPGVSQQPPQSGSPSVSSLRASSLNTASPPPFHLGRAAGMPPPPPGFPQMPMPPGLQNRMPQDQIFPPGQGAFRYGPDMMHLPPGLAPPLGRSGYGGPPPPPGFSQPTGDPLLGLNHGFGLPSDIGPPPQQPRQMSGSMDPLSASSLSSQPINRPTPIGRPSSIVHGQRSADNSHDSAEESEHLGSRALLDDEPDAPVLGQNPLRQRSIPGPNLRTQFPPPSGFMDAAFGSPFHTQWGSPSSSAFTPQSALGGSLWSAGAANPFAAAPGAPVAPLRARPPVNAVALRHMLCQACQSLRDAGQATGEGYVDFSAVRASIHAALGHDVPDSELLAISETEGNPQNGGGSFDGAAEGERRLIRWVSGAGSGGDRAPRPLGAPGDIGSPVIGAGRS